MTLSSLNEWVWPSHRPKIANVVSRGLGLGLLGALIVYFQYHLQGQTIVLSAWPIGGPTFGKVLAIMDSVIFTPLMESAFMIIGIRLLQRLKIETAVVPLFSASIWMAFHIYARGILSVWTIIPFYYFALCVLGFPKIGSNAAYLSVSLCHGIMNSMCTATALILTNWYC